MISDGLGSEFDFWVPTWNQKTKNTIEEKPSTNFSTDFGTWVPKNLILGTNCWPATRVERGNILLN